MAHTRIILIGLGGEIPRAAGKPGGRPPAHQLGFELDLGVSSLDIPSRDITNSYTFYWLVRASKAERGLALIMYVFPGVCSQFSFCILSLIQSAFGKGLCPAAPCGVR